VYKLPMRAAKMEIPAREEVAHNEAARFAFGVARCHGSFLCLSANVASAITITGTTAGSSIAGIDSDNDSTVTTIPITRNLTSWASPLRRVGGMGHRPMGLFVSPLLVR
jgi:hypothetical protein